MITSKADRDRIRQRDKARKDRRLIALGQLAETMIIEWLHGKGPYECMEELKKAAKG